MLKKRMEDRLARPGGDQDAGDAFFSLLARCYELGVGWRNRHLDAGKGVRRLPAPVISVGNLVAGGTGKTPMVRHLARMLTAWGLRPAILSRGYGGKLEKKGGQVSDGRQVFLDAFVAGDEPFLLAKTVPAAVFVGADRYQSGLRALEAGADVLVLDDGFQHRKLFRDLDLVLLDARHPLGNGRLLPRGSLREPPEALRRAHALLLTHCGEVPFPGDSLPSFFVQGNEARERCPWFATSHCQVLWPEGRPVSEAVPEGKALAFAGIADGKGFVNGLVKEGWHLAEGVFFADHHAYTPSDLKKLMERAYASGADSLVTTAKDAVKLPVAEGWPLPLHVVDVELDFADGENFRLWLGTCLSGLGLAMPEVEGRFL